MVGVSKSLYTRLRQADFLLEFRLQALKLSSLLNRDLTVNCFLAPNCRSYSLNIEAQSRLVSYISKERADFRRY